MKIQQAKMEIITTIIIVSIGLFSCKREPNLQKIPIKNAAVRKSMASVTGTTYYVDPNGNDSNSGTSTATAWKTLGKVTSTTFSPGDRILFKSGGVWTGGLQPKGSGTPGALIVIDKYDGEVKPVINGGGLSNDFSTVFLKDQSYWEINNLEVTNTTPQGPTYRLTGIRAECPRNPATPFANISIKNCYIHDVNSALVGSSNYSKFQGGIIINGKFDSVLIQNCHIANCSMEGIHTMADDDFSRRSKNIIIENNLIENMEGDGIVIAEVAGGSKATNNVVHNVCKSNAANFAGLWTYYSYQTVISHNEVYGMTGGGPNDGMAWDSDYGCDGDIIEYNYSHDNNGGFLLLMPGASNIVVRYNVSVNDVGPVGQKKLFLIGAGGGSNNQIYNNVFYLKGQVDKLFWGHPTGVTTSNNIFFAAPNTHISNLVDNGPTIPNNTAAFLNNCFYPSAEFSLVWGTAVQVNNFYADPQFVNPVWGAGFNSINGFKVGVTSPCRGNGISISNNGGLDFWGNALPSGNPDVGAFQQTPTIQIIDGAVYTFISAVNNTSVIDVTDGATNNETRLQLYHSNNTNAQKWMARYVGNGYYTFKSMLDTTKVMDVREGATANGTALQLFQSNNTNAQKWLVSYDGSYFRVKSALIDKSVDVNGGAVTDGTKIQLWDNNNGNAQKFKLVRP